VFKGIVDVLSFSFPFPPSTSSTECCCYKHVLSMCLYMIMLVLCTCLCFGSIFHLWKKTCDLCLSKSILLNLTLCLPIASIFLHFTWHHSPLWLS
jgi:hypothetical protein